jgi:hypothetical protein
MVRLKGYEATGKLFPGVVKTEALDELCEKVVVRDAVRNATKDSAHN